MATYLCLLFFLLSQRDLPLSQPHFALVPPLLMATVEVGLNLFPLIPFDCSHYARFDRCCLVSAESCGQRPDNMLNRPMYRMFGGRESDITEQPWQAIINVYVRRHRQYHHKCGGVLINSCWVLSAAHCFDEEWVPFLYFNRSTPRENKN